MAKELVYIRCELCRGRIKRTDMLKKGWCVSGKSHQFGTKYTMDSTALWCPKCFKRREHFRRLMVHFGFLESE